MLGVTPEALPDSPPTSRMLFAVRTAMRDGVNLVSDIWLPKEPGRYPALLVRLPYGRSNRDSTQPGSPSDFAAYGKFFVEHGYVLVVQDTRGRGDSEGQSSFFFSDGRDGYDTIEWIAKQPWSNGKVGMWGGSYLATVQWLAAREHPPHLLCIAPAAAAGRYFDEIPYQGGAFALSFAIGFHHFTSGHGNQVNTDGLDMNEIFRHRPLLTVDDAFGQRMPEYREFLEHDTLDEYWKRIQFTAADFKTIDIPSLTMTGWFDDDQPGALFYWRGMRAHSPAKDEQYLIAGPWTHAQVFVGGDRRLGAFEFSPDATYDPKALELAFFDYCLKGTAPKFDFPRARIYVTGSNRWRIEDEYPPRRAQVRALYFHSGGKANTLGGDGRLSWQAPKREPTDSYRYVPDDPVMPADNEEPGTDQRYIERRDDVLVYTSDPLKGSVEVVGDVFVHLYAATDARDTDFTARLLDVEPQGRALQLGPVPVGIIRARYRNSREHTELLTPGKREHYRIELFDIAHAFLAGHRIRVEISSSYAPMFHPNPNTGNAIATDTDSKPANQTIFHEASASSYVALPTLPE